LEDYLEEEILVEIEKWVKIKYFNQILYLQELEIFQTDLFNCRIKNIQMILPFAKILMA
jgi:hypothetical protein